MENLPLSIMDSTLVQLIKSYETYRSGFKNGVNEDTMTDFIIYLNSQLGQMNNTTVNQGTEAWTNFNRKTLEEIAGSTLGKLGRYVDHYSRKVMPQTDLGSIDEFTYLMQLMQEDHQTKTSLIHHNIHPITSGTEIIKRLLNKGYITQLDDEHDKRSVRVSITPQGRAALFSSFEKLSMITRIVSADLSDSELIQLVNILKKLDNFHLKIYHEARNMEMDEIVSTYIPA